MNLHIREAPEAGLPFLIQGQRALPTIGVDGRNLWYNPEFIKSVKLKELMGLMAHEALHPAFLHLTRVYNRDPKRWNMAGDYIINLVVKKAKLDLPEGALYDEKYESWTTDEVYNDLESQQKQSKGSKDPGKGCCQGMIKPQGSGDDGEPTEEERAAMDQQWRGILTQAATMAKAAGKLPGGIELLIDDLLKPTISWQSVLAAFIENACRNNYDWEVPDQSYLQNGIYVPSLHNKEVGTIGIIIDTSGSIGARELQQYASEVSSILQTVRPEKIYVIYVDAAVADVQEFDVSDLPLKFEPKGGGGTDFKPGFKWLEDNDIHPKCVIYFTDLCCSSYPQKPDYPVMWAATMAEHYIDKVPFGEVLPIDLSVSDE